MVIFHLKILKKYRCVDASLRFLRILVKVAVDKFLESLNPNLMSDFLNSKRRIEYGGQKFENYSELDEIIRTRVFGDTEPKSVVRFSISKIENAIWRLEWLKGPQIDRIGHVMFLRTLNPEFSKEVNIFLFCSQYDAEKTIWRW